MALADAVEGQNGKPRRPPKGAETRWAGILPQILWVNEFFCGLSNYEEPDDCVPNDDGTTYGHHALDEDDCLVIMQLVTMLIYLSFATLELS